MVGCVVRAGSALPWLHRHRMAPTTRTAAEAVRMHALSSACVVHLRVPQLLCRAVVGVCAAVQREPVLMSHTAVGLHGPVDEGDA